MLISGSFDGLSNDHLMVYWEVSLAQSLAERKCPNFSNTIIFNRFNVGTRSFGANTQSNRGALKPQATIGTQALSIYWLK